MGRKYRPKEMSFKTRTLTPGLVLLYLSGAELMLRVVRSVRQVGKVGIKSLTLEG